MDPAAGVAADAVEEDLCGMVSLELCQLLVVEWQPVPRDSSHRVVSIALELYGRSCHFLGVVSIMPMNKA